MKYTTHFQDLMRFGTGPVTKEKPSAVTKFIVELYGQANCVSLSDLSCVKAGKVKKAKKKRGGQIRSSN